MIDLLSIITGFLILVSALLILIVSNPIHSILLLIITFFGSSILLLILGVDYLAMIFLIIYVGAIAVLFLFVIMMFNIKIVEIKENILRYLPAGFILSILLLIEVVSILNLNISQVNYNNTVYNLWINNLYFNNYSINQIANLLYTYNFYWFIISSLILLVAMIGSIILTLHKKSFVKRQEIYKQIGRTYKEALIYVK